MKSDKNIKKYYTSQRIKGYELIDSGQGQKLERFGGVVLNRPEPSAVWRKTMGEEEWDKICDFKFIEEGKTTGYWQRVGNDIPRDWHLNYHYKQCRIRLDLKLTSFKHVGVFPEQSINWEYIFDAIKSMQKAEPKVLNLFAYTGGASLVAKAAGADVVHVDSIRQVVTWANENQTSSGLKDIRWVIEDAVRFVGREVKRGNTYNGIILDPPAFGHGPKGQKWKLDAHLPALMDSVFKILDPKEHFLILNVYSSGFDGNHLQDLMRDLNPQIRNYEVADIITDPNRGVELNLGSVLRYNYSKK